MRQVFALAALIAAIIITAAAVTAEPPSRATAAAAHTPTLYTDEWPPERFAGDRLATAIRTVAPAGISALCDTGGPPPPGMHTEACAFNTAEGPFIILPNPCTYPHDDDYARLLCHELAHGNGWPRTHGP